MSEFQLGKASFRTVEKIGDIPVIKGEPKAVLALYGRALDDQLREMRTQTSKLTKEMSCLAKSLELLDKALSK